MPGHTTRGPVLLAVSASRSASCGGVFCRAALEAQQQGNRELSLTRIGDAKEIRYAKENPLAKAICMFVHIARLSCSPTGAACPISSGFHHHHPHLPTPPSPDTPIFRHPSEPPTSRRPSEPRHPQVPPASPSRYLRHVCLILCVVVPYLLRAASLIRIPTTATPHSPRPYISASLSILSPSPQPCPTTTRVLRGRKPLGRMIPAPTTTLAAYLRPRRAQSSASRPKDLGVAFVSAGS